MCHVPNTPLEYYFASTRQFWARRFYAGECAAHTVRAPLASVLEDAIDIERDGGAHTQGALHVARTEMTV